MLRTSSVIYERCSERQAILIVHTLLSNGVTLTRRLAPRRGLRSFMIALEPPHPDSEHANCVWLRYRARESSPTRSSLLRKHARSRSRWVVETGSTQRTFRSDGSKHSLARTR